MYGDQIWDMKWSDYKHHFAKIILIIIQWTDNKLVMLCVVWRSPPVKVETYIRWTFFKKITWLHVALSQLN